MRNEFAEEVLVHLDAVYGLALRLTGGDEARSEELVRKAVLEAYRHPNAHEAGTDVRAWIMAILRNTFIDEFRRRRKLPGPVEHDVEDLDPDGDVFEPVSDEVLAEGIEALPGELRVPLVLADLEGYSYRAMAEDLDLPLRTVKSRLFEARRRLQRELYERALEKGYAS